MKYWNWKFWLQFDSNLTVYNLKVVSSMTDMKPNWSFSVNTSRIGWFKEKCTINKNLIMV